MSDRVTLVDGDGVELGTSTNKLGMALTGAATSTGAPGESYVLLDGDGVELGTTANPLYVALS